MRTLLAPTSLDDFHDKIVAALLAGGWTNDGAPTATILVGAADTEGRAPYVNIIKTAPDIIDIELGSGRTGDTLTMAGTLAIGGSRIYYVENYYQMFTSDRWLFIEELTNTEQAVMMGMLESPYTLAVAPSPLFLYRNHALGSATQINCLLMHSTSTFLLTPYTPAAPSVWYGSNSIFLKYWQSAAAIGLPYPNRQFVRGSGNQGPSYMSHKWVIAQRQYNIAGYVKNARLVYGMNTATADQNRGGAVQIGDYLYYRAGYDSNNGMLTYITTSENMCVMLRGGLANG